MNDATIVTSLMRAESRFFFKNDNFFVWRLRQNRIRGCQADYATADNDEINVQRLSFRRHFFNAERLTTSSKVPSSVIREASMR